MAMYYMIMIMLLVIAWIIYEAKRFNDNMVNIVQVKANVKLQKDIELDEATEEIITCALVEEMKKHAVYSVKQTDSGEKIVTCSVYIAKK